MGRYVTDDARHTSGRFAMGKAKKSHKNVLRFDPLARGPAKSGFTNDVDEEPRKNLSAHQQRHLERKRLQAEAEALKQQRRKISKSDKVAYQREKKALSQEMKSSKKALQEASSRRFTDAPPSVSPEASPSPFTGFNLPAP